MKIEQIEIKKQGYIRQSNLEKTMHKNIICHFIICLFIIIVTLCGAVNKHVENSEKVVEFQNETVKPQTFSTVTVQVDTNTPSDDKGEVDAFIYPEFVYNNSKGLDYEDNYLLAKIAMAEAEGCSIQIKVLVIMTVLNRVQSDEFPDSIEEVIFEKYKDVYQFTPVANGRWDKVEPNEDCWEAVQIVMEAPYDYSNGALYFESCEDEDNWHSRNLKLLYELDGMRFYK